MLSLTLHVYEEPVLWVFESEMLTRISGPNTKEVQGEGCGKGIYRVSERGREMINTYEP
jgi:hypothetical protein